MMNPIKANITTASSGIEVKLLEGAYPLKHGTADGGHDDDVGFDICSPVDTIIPSHSSTFVDLKVCIALPKNVAGMLKSKSGLNKKYSIVGEGVVDPGYQGSIGIKLYNHGNEPLTIHKGDKLIQICFVPVIIPAIKYVDTFAEENTDRGCNGFGSTGR